MRRNIITTAVFLIGITVYLALLGHIVQNQSVMQREECAQAAKIYADELEKDFGTSWPRRCSRCGLISPASSWHRRAA